MVDTKNRPGSWKFLSHPKTGELLRTCVLCCWWVLGHHPKPRMQKNVPNSFCLWLPRFEAEGEAPSEAARKGDFPHRIAAEQGPEPGQGSWRGTGTLVGHGGWNRGSARNGAGHRVGDSQILWLSSKLCLQACDVGVAESQNHQLERTARKVFGSGGAIRMG